MREAFITSKPAFEERLKKILQAEMKFCHIDT
jgi:hypothetical protein